MTSTDWLVSMTFVPDLPIEKKQLDVLSDRFDELDWSVSVSPDATISVTSYTDDEPWGQNLPMVIDIAQRALADAGVGAEVVKVQFMTEERREVEASHPALPDLVAATDVAKILGVSRQRVNQLHRDHSGFPEPVVQTGAGSLWTKYAVERFQLSWDRRPGRRETEGAPVVVPLRARSGNGVDAVGLPGGRRVEA